MRPPHPRRPLWVRRLAITARDVTILLRQFRGSLLAFAATVIGGGSLFFSLAQRAGQNHPANLIEAWYLALLMVFLQAGDALPAAWQLELFYFVLPILGLAILSQGAADFGLLLFNRRARGEAWQVALAQTFSNHIVIIGLGHLGFRVARALHQLGESFVAIELDPEADLLAQVQSWDVPIIQGDANKYDVLRQAGIDRAHTVVIVTSDDTLNLQIAIHTRAVNPKIRTIVRLFDDDFAREVRIAFGITAAYSASALAAPAFAAAAADLDLTQPIDVGGRSLSMHHFTLRRGSPLAELTVGEVERAYDLSIVLLRREDRAELHPADELRLAAGDQISVFADSAALRRLNRVNR
ncbi:MAG: TrkA family potassium uptake protein [Anaerolineales bacterium]|nr:TrkA family potassium uptake protein [Anaerolineales bacterium]